MSPEFLLLIFFFVLLPLAQQLFQYVRQRSPTGRNADLPATAGEPAGVGPPSEGRRLSDLEGPKPTGTARHGAVLQEPPASPKAARMAIRESTARQRLHPHVALKGLRGRAGLGRGIVLMAILGPCRANDRYEWPERTGHR